MLRQNVYVEYRCCCYCHMVCVSVYSTGVNVIEDHNNINNNEWMHLKHKNGVYRLYWLIFHLSFHCTRYQFCHFYYCGSFDTSCNSILNVYFYYFALTFLRLVNLLACTTMHNTQNDKAKVKEKPFFLLSTFEQTCLIIS